MKSGSRSFIPVFFSFITISIGLIGLLLQNVFLAAVFVIAAALIQKTGKLFAERLYAEFDIVKELSSMSELVSFGILPAILAWKIGLSDNINFLGYLPILFFVISAVYRLSRYNLSSGSDANRGLSVIGSAIIIAISIFFKPNATFLSILMFILSLLMLSRIKFHS